MRLSNLTTAAVLALSAGVLSGCGAAGQDSAQQAAGTVRVAAPAETATAVATATTLDAQVTDSYQSIRDALDDSDLAEVGIIVGNANGELFRYSPDRDGDGTGDYDFTEQVPLASASKLLAATVAYRMIQAGKITAAAQPQQYLNFWTNSGTLAGESLEILLSFRSGFNETPDRTYLVGCEGGVAYTVNTCARRIYNDYGNGHLGQPADTAPGSTLSYGEEHMQIAGAMMLGAEGSGNWNDLFNKYVRDALGLTPQEQANFSIHWNTPNYNPWVSAGGIATANDYALFLYKLFRGDLVSNLDDFFAPRTLGLPRSYIPEAIANTGDTWHYAQGSWVECPAGTDASNFNTLCAGKKINSSPGAFGFTPWVDRTNGYWAIIATNEQNGGSLLAVPLEQQVQPLIVAALQS